jgi:rhomboid protease GluP
MMVLMDNRRMCPHCRAFITTRDRVCPYCNEAVAPRAVARDEGVHVLGGAIPHFRFNTSIILLINVGLFLATALYSLQRMGNSQAFWNIDPQTLIAFGANYIPGLRAGQWWRLVTAGFLHGGLLHIGMNSWVLFDLGAQVEEVFGAARMLVIYFAGTVCGFYLSAVGGNMLSVGASAGLMGLIGAMIAFGIHHRSGIGREIRSMYIRWAVYILVLGLLPGLRTDNFAHIGGLAGGFLIAYIAGTPRLTASPAETVWRVASWIAIFLTALSFLKWYLWFSQVS